MSASILPSPWIINRRQDLTWFIGGALVAYVFLAVAASYGFAPIRLILLWALALDGPHVYSTATRVLFDPAERRRVGFLWFALIPLAIATALLIVLTGYGILALLVLTWGHYHIFKQHMGFVFLFKRKARETQDFKLDKYFTLGSMFLPYVYFVIVYVTGFRSLLPLFAFAGFAFAAYYAWHQTRLPKVNAPKLLLLAAFIPLHWAAFLWAASAEEPGGRVMALIITTNIGHSFQYLRLMWFHNNNRYSDRDGLLGSISRKWIYFFAIAFVLAVPTRFVGTSNSLWAVIPYSLIMFHYMVDAKIWRVRGDTELAAALHL